MNKTTKNLGVVSDLVEVTSDKLIELYGERYDKFCQYIATTYRDTVFIKDKRVYFEFLDYLLELRLMNGKFFFLTNRLDYKLTDAVFQNILLITNDGKDVNAFSDYHTLFKRCVSIYDKELEFFNLEKERAIYQASNEGFLLSYDTNTLFKPLFYGTETRTFSFAYSVVKEEIDIIVNDSFEVNEIYNSPEFIKIVNNQEKHFINTIEIIRYINREQLNKYLVPIFRMVIGFGERVDELEYTNNSWIFKDKKYELNDLIKTIELDTLSRYVSLIIQHAINKQKNERMYLFTN